MALLTVVCEMAPYLLLGFLIAGILHVFVPQKFYADYLSKDNKWSVLWAALLGVPLPLCSCGVIPTAIGLRNEKASKGAVASFLIATPQTGIDSILATFSLLGLGFAIIRPAAALITGVCGGLLVNRFVRDDDAGMDASASCQVESGNRVWRVLKYAYYEMIQSIGGRLVLGLLVAALIQVVIPDEFGYPLFRRGVSFPGVTLPGKVYVVVILQVSERLYYPIHRVPSSIRHSGESPHECNRSCHSR